MDEGRRAEVCCIFGGGGEGNCDSDIVCRQGRRLLERSGMSCATDDSLYRSQCSCCLLERRQGF